MLRTKLLLAALSAAALTAACAPTVGQNGFQAIDAKPNEIMAGTDTKQTVLTKLGTPSTTSTFERDNIWYYISQVTEKYTYNPARVTQRSVTEITFNDAGQVAEVRTLGLDDGQQIAMNGRETPTRGRQMTILEQLLGNVGRGQLPRTDEDVPGQRRPD
ncbi:MAG: outer membrane protein assembly factor BamE [Brevundimonas sp.]|uniref:outer membrane protein assembly factor BamE n=1 Tax=Brevundimonas sp. TaxID=1871086 RepID=UPI00391BB624